MNHGSADADQKADQPTQKKQSDDSPNHIHLPLRLLEKTIDTEILPETAPKEMRAIT